MDDRKSFSRLVNHLTNSVGEAFRSLGSGKRTFKNQEGGEGGVTISVIKARVQVIRFWR